MRIHKRVYGAFRDDIVNYIKTNILTPEERRELKVDKIPIRSRKWWDLRIMRNDIEGYVGPLLYGKHSYCEWEYDRIRYDFFPANVLSFADITGKYLAVILEGLRVLIPSSFDRPIYDPFENFKNDIENEARILLAEYLKSEHPKLLPLLDINHVTPTRELQNRRIGESNTNILITNPYIVNTEIIQKTLTTFFKDVSNYRGQLERSWCLTNHAASKNWKVESFVYEMLTKCYSFQNLHIWDITIHMNNENDIWAECKVFVNVKEINILSYSMAFKDDGNRHIVVIKENQLLFNFLDGKLESIQGKNVPVEKYIKGMYPELEQKLPEFNSQPFFINKIRLLKPILRLRNQGWFNNLGWFIDDINVIGLELF